MQSKFVTAYVLGKIAQKNREAVFPLFYQLIFDYG
jgi:hypothetical protein